MKMNIRHLTTMFLLSIVTLASLSVEAGEKNPEVKVAFAGYRNNHPVYKMEVSNPENLKLAVTIRDQEGIVLHQEIVEGRNITRSYCFLKDELGSSDIVVEVSRYENTPFFASIRIEKRKMK
jgi:hypothetical protein